MADEREQLWLVWSNEHLAWWKPGGHGYTTLTHEAGRFFKPQADRICTQANIVPRDPPNEIAVLAPDYAWAREQFAQAANKHFGP